MKKAIALVIALSGLLVWTAAEAGSRKRGEPPAPRLLAPSETVDLKAKNGVEFRWSGEGAAPALHYEFNLYKGTRSYADARIHHQELPSRTHSLVLDTSHFKPGETYTWSLRLSGARRGRAASSIFKIDA